MEIPKNIIDDVCMSYRHDYGLMGPIEKENLQSDMKEWIRALSKNENTVIIINGMQILDGEKGDLETRKKLYAYKNIKYVFNKCGHGEELMNTIDEHIGESDEL